jgi:hypothetical protein
MKKRNCTAAPETGWQPPVFRGDNRIIEKLVRMQSGYRANRFFFAKAYTAILVVFLFAVNDFCRDRTRRRKGGAKDF